MSRHRITRRGMLKVLSAAGLGTLFARHTEADEIALTTMGAMPHGLLVNAADRSRSAAKLVGGQVIQPERPLAVASETDVLVVGGGAAGFAAAVAAARTGAKTILVERYGYLGGLWTGGLVLLVISSHAKENGDLVKVLRGVGDELLERLTKFDGAIINQKPGKYNPTSDPEATKFMMDEMIREAGVNVFFHSWMADVILDGPAIRGVIFESKSGRQAILAKVVVDATGDGDVFAAAGAEHEKLIAPIGLIHRLGNVDRVDSGKLKEAGFKSLGELEPLTSTKWVDMQGPSADCLDVKELTKLEIQHRHSIWKRVQLQRQIPGGEKLFLLQTAPQLGVRVSRLLAGTKQLTDAETRAGTKFPDTIAVGGARGGERPGWPIPYGVLLPKKLDNLLAAGRCVSVDEKLIEEMRLIASCLTTGHAAGTAAALAVKHGCRPRDLAIPELQKTLIQQGAYLG